jgi:hypothetical protein
MVFILPTEYGNKSDEKNEEAAAHFMLHPQQAIF